VPLRKPTLRSVTSSAGRVRNSRDLAKDACAEPIRCSAINQARLETARLHHLLAERAGPPLPPLPPSPAITFAALTIVTT